MQGLCFAKVMDYEYLSLRFLGRDYLKEKSKVI